MSAWPCPLSCQTWGGSWAAPHPPSPPAPAGGGGMRQMDPSPHQMPSSPKPTGWVDILIIPCWGQPWSRACCPPDRAALHFGVMGLGEPCQQPQPQSPAGKRKPQAHPLPRHMACGQAWQRGSKLGGTTMSPHNVLNTPILCSSSQPKTPQQCGLSPGDPWLFGQTAEACTPSLITGFI